VNPLQGFGTSGYAYTGREWDSETGIYYYRARYYEPKLGRFISEDPIGLGDGPNRYAYVHNSPVERLDPYGFQATPATPAPPPPSHRPGHQLPKIYSLCDTDESVVFWDFSPFNPNSQRGRYIVWKNAFIDECYRVEKLRPGRDYRARVAPINPNMVSQSDWPSTAIGVCCEKKCKKCP
jgi:RHS repeat-associated protein